MPLDKNKIRELLADQYSDKSIHSIEAVQFQLAQTSDAPAGQSVVNGLFIGDLAIVPVGSAIAGTLTVAINNSVSTQNIERVVMDGLPAAELKGIAFDNLAPAYVGTDAAGTKICSLLFSGYKVAFS